jgi:uncharacterized membrane protein (UPF0136 family)
MKLRTIATPLTIGSFILVCATGLCLLFGFRGGLVDPLHELSSIVLVIGVALHVVVNWKATLAHLRRPWGLGLAGVFATLSIVAVLSLGYDGRDGKAREIARGSMELLLDSDLREIASVTHRSESELVGILSKEGYSRFEANPTLRDLSRANGKEAMQALALLLRSSAPIQVQSTR